MPDNPNDRDEKPADERPAPSSFPLKPSGAVVVTHLDTPPPGGKRTIHPRRPAPIVPDRPPRKKDERSPEGEAPKGPSSDSNKL